MSEDAVRLQEERARLFKVEMKGEISGYLRDGPILSLDGLVGAVGFALLSSRLPRGAGVVHMLLGGATVLAMMKRITKRSPVPRRIAEEIGEDRRWSREMTWRRLGNKVVSIFLRPAPVPVPVIYPTRPPR